MNGRIKELAEQAGLIADGEHWFSAIQETDVRSIDLERFAELVAEDAVAKEREINRELLNALQFFAKAEINDDNCASLEVAQRRVRTFAANAIAKAEEQA